MHNISVQEEKWMIDVTKTYSRINKHNKEMDTYITQSNTWQEKADGKYAKKSGVFILHFLCHHISTAESALNLKQVKQMRTFLTFPVANNPHLP